MIDIKLLPLYSFGSIMKLDEQPKKYIESIIENDFKKYGENNILYCQFFYEYLRK